MKPFGELLISLVVLLVFGYGQAVASDPPPVDSFFTTNLNQDPELSPSGRYLSVISPNPDSVDGNQLTVYDLRSNKPVGAFYMKVRQAYWPELFWHTHWLTDHRIIVETVRRVGGYGPYLTGKIYSIKVGDDPRDSYMRLLQTPKMGEFLGSKYYEDLNFYRVLEYLRDDADHFISTNATPPRSPLLHDVVDRRPRAFLVDATKGVGLAQHRDALVTRSHDVKEIAESPLPNGSLLADHLGEVRVAVGYDEKTGNSVWLYRPDGKSAWKRMPGELVDKFAEGPYDFTPDDKDLYLEEYVPQTGTLGLYRFDAATGAKILLYDDPQYDVVDLIEGYRNDRVVAAMTMPGRPHIVLLDTGPTAKVLGGFARGFPGETPQVLSASRDGGEMVVEISSDRDPGRYFLVDTKTLHADQLMTRRPDIDPKQMAAMTPVAFRARDGLTIHGYLTLPNGRESRLPMIVYVHGGPHGIRDEWGFDPMVQLLASRGYAVLQINYRGSSGYGWRFEQAGFHHWGTTMQYDVIDGTRWAVKQGYADSKRICIFGGSYGGFAALRSSELAPDLYRCTVGYDGVYDLPMMFKTGDIPLTSGGSRYLHIVLGNDMAELADQSPVKHVADLSGGILLVQGSDDVRAPHQQFDELKARLEAAHKPFEVVYRHREGHGFSAISDQRELADKLLLFFAHYIGDSGKSSAGAAVGGIGARLLRRR